MVRAGGQSILIDFASAQPGPLVADPAQLEVSLALRAEASERSWQETMDKLYTPLALQMVPPPMDPTLPLASLWDTVRQVRRIGLGDQSSPGEYAAAVAVALLRKAMHRNDVDEQSLRRPYMCWLAARLTKELGRG
jgi:hypothetical protein